MADEKSQIQSTNPQSGGVINTIVGTGMGLLTAGYNDARQRRMNKDLIRQQTESGKEMARFNKQMGLEMWEATGYEAQRKQMEAAGINPGLMYGGAGAGGTTAGASGQMASGGAPQGGGELGMGIQMAAQLAMIKAQIENTNADTEKKKVEANKLSGVDTENVGASTDLTRQNTRTGQIDQAIKEYHRDIAEIEARIKLGTEDNQTQAIKQAQEILEQKLRGETVDANVKERTQGQVIKQINTQTKEQQLRIKAQEAGLIKTGAETKAVEQSIRNMMRDINNAIQQNMRSWDQMSQKEREIIINQSRDGNINTEGGAMQQWINLITETIGKIK